MLARMSNFTKGHCNVLLSSGSRCPCDTGRCAFDPTGAGDVESLKCHICSHRMWDHHDSLDDGDGDGDSAENFDLESGHSHGHTHSHSHVGDPPPYAYDEGARRAAQFETSTTGLVLPAAPAQSHHTFYHRYEPPLATTTTTTTTNMMTSNAYNHPQPRGNLPVYNLPPPLPSRRPSRMCTANLIIGIILGFVIVATPVIAYRVVTS